ncbi:MAG: hypothetical protein ACI4M3_07860 [Acutalibacteraceae bacterium]
MIRGISRNIIEVTETGSQYYDRALLVIKPEYASAQHELLEREAKRLLNEMGAPSMLQKHKGRWKKVLFACVFALLGAGISLMFVLPLL